MPRSYQRLSHDRVAGAKGLCQAAAAGDHLRGWWRHWEAAAHVVGWAGRAELCWNRKNKISCRDASSRVRKKVPGSDPGLWWKAYSSGAFGVTLVGLWRHPADTLRPKWWSCKILLIVTKPSDKRIQLSRWWLWHRSHVRTAKSSGHRFNSNRVLSYFSWFPS